ncbi:MAG: hypothetical protein E6Z79_00710 [Haemophilus parainfluenzae]|nr:hypothetical protein [Haemophilus parainfluenzae]
MSEVKRGLRYGENVEWFLNELAAYETGDLSDGGFEVYGEDDRGIEGSCEIDIPELAADAAQLIADLQGQLAQRDAQIAALTAERLDLKQYVVDELKYLSPTTPATDAAANALRAEGVEMAISQSFMDGIPVNRMQFIARMTAFANQLREGK